MIPHYLLRTEVVAGVLQHPARRPNLRRPWLVRDRARRLDRNGKPSFTELKRRSCCRTVDLSLHGEGMPVNRCKRMNWTLLPQKLHSKRRRRSSSPCAIGCGMESFGRDDSAGLSAPTGAGGTSTMHLRCLGWVGWGGGQVHIMEPCTDSRQFLPNMTGKHAQNR